MHIVIHESKKEVSTLLSDILLNLQCADFLLVIWSSTCFPTPNFYHTFFSYCDKWHMNQYIVDTVNKFKTHAGYLSFISISHMGLWYEQLYDACGDPWKQEESLHPTAPNADIFNKTFQPYCSSSDSSTVWYPIKFTCSVQTFFLLSQMLLFGPAPAFLFQMSTTYFSYGDTWHMNQYIDWKLINQRSYC